MLNFLFLTLTFFVPVSYAFAHAYPITYTPEAYSTLPQAPSEVQISMSQGLAPTGHGVSIYGPDGVVLPAVASLVDPRDDRTLRRSVTDMGEGTYTVSWHAISREDGHVTRGAFSFLVGTSTVASASVLPMRPPTEWLLVLLSTVSLITFLLCVLQVFVLSSKKEVWRQVAYGERTMSAVALQALPFACVLGMLWYLSARSLEAALLTLWGQVLLGLTLLVCMCFVLVSIGSRTRTLRFRCGVCTWSYAWTMAALTGVITLLSMWLFFLSHPVYAFPPWSISKESSEGRMMLLDDMRDPASLILRTHRADGTLRTVSPEVVLHESTLGIGPMVVPVTTIAPGTFMVPGSMLSPVGTWQLAITVREEGGYDHSDTFTVAYPDDLTSARHRALVPQEGGYRVGIFIFALILMGCGLFALLGRRVEVDVYDTTHHRQVGRALLVTGVVMSTLFLIVFLLVRVALLVVFPSGA